MRPFTTEWKTFVVDAIAKDPKRRTPEERAAIELSKAEANNPDEFLFRRTLGELIDCENYFEAMVHHEAMELSPAELEAAKVLVMQTAMLSTLLAKWMDCDLETLLDPTGRDEVFEHLQHQALTRS